MCKRSCCFVTYIILCSYSKFGCIAILLGVYKLSNNSSSSDQFKKTVYIGMLDLDNVNLCIDLFL